MKKLLLLVFAICLTSSFAYSEIQHLTNFPVVLGSNIDLPTDLQINQVKTNSNLPIFDPAKGSFGKLMFAQDNLQDEPIAWSTRIHPYPTDQNAIDTARTIYDRNNPTDQKSYFYVGDTQMPVSVGNSTGQIVFKLNGYFQALPSLSYYFPQLYNGTFTVDSISCLFYSYPASPVSTGYLFSMLNISNLNLPNFGSDNFNPAAFEFEYNSNIYDKLQAAYFLEPSYINSRVQQQGTGYIINPTTIDFNNQDLQPIRTYGQSDRMMILLAKEDLNDLKDTTSLVGAWEWTIPATHCFAGCVRHYSAGIDSVSLLSATIAPMKPSQSSPYYNEWLQKYPYYMQETIHRKNYRFIVYGRYTGEYNPNSVKEVDNFSEYFELYQNAPNPVQTSTKISFTIKSSNFVTLKVYNQLGEEVASLVHEFMNPGTYESNFEVNNLPSGSYFYTLSTENFTKTLPMIIVK